LRGLLHTAFAESADRGPRNFLHQFISKLRSACAHQDESANRALEEPDNLLFGSRVPGIDAGC
jgi:hypothetical protein